MGSSQSKVPEPDVHAQLVERLRALELKNRTEQSTLDEKGYVVIGETSQDTSHLSRNVSITAAEQWEQELLEDPKNRLAMAAFTANNPNAIVSQRTVKPASEATFNIKIPTEGNPVTNQRASGRCWLFASTNVFRIALMRSLNLEAFELSQAYLFFWDKLEKANYFLEAIIETHKDNETIDSRIVQELLKAPVNDGGQWDMVANLVSKYGLVPHSLYPDSFNAMNSGVMNRLITTKLREDALRLRELGDKQYSSAAQKDKSLALAKANMLREIHLMLTLTLGPPPSPKKDFEWEYYDKDSKYHKIVASPIKFAKQLSSQVAIRSNGGTDVHKLFSLVNDPRNEFETLLTVDKLGNVWDGRPITYVNVKSSSMKKACIGMLEAGLPVFFGCDVGKYSDNAKGVMDPKLYDYELGFNVSFSLSKAERLLAKESAMTHAMVFTAVHVENGKSVRWRVENSWSNTAGDHGYFVMSDDWFDEFVYQAVVGPKFVQEAERDVLKTKPKVLPLWDPMALA